MAPINTARDKSWRAAIHDTATGARAVVCV